MLWKVSQCSNLLLMYSNCVYLEELDKPRHIRISLHWKKWSIFVTLKLWYKSQHKLTNCLSICVCIKFKTNSHFGYRFERDPCILNMWWQQFFSTQLKISYFCEAHILNMWSDMQNTQICINILYLFPNLMQTQIVLPWPKVDFLINLSLWAESYITKEKGI